jgi:hypothetical protein
MSNFKTWFVNKISNLAMNKQDMELLKFYKSKYPLVDCNTCNLFFERPSWLRQGYDYVCKSCYNKRFDRIKKIKKSCEFDSLDYD